MCGKPRSGESRGERLPRAHTKCREVGRCVNATAMEMKIAITLMTAMSTTMEVSTLASCAPSSSGGLRLSRRKNIPTGIDCFAGMMTTPSLYCPGTCGVRSAVACRFCEARLCRGEFRRWRERVRVGRGVSYGAGMKASARAIACSRRSHRRVVCG